MAERSPPVPPAARSRGSGREGRPPKESAATRPQASRNTAKQGRQGNISQNTRNQGYQQDR